MGKYYNFKDCKSDVQSLVHAINLHGENLIGAEIGVFKGESFCTLLQNCPNIKTLYGVDAYKPYTDCLKTPYDGTPAYSIDEKDIGFIKLTAYHNIQYSGYVDKAIIYEKDSTLASADFQQSVLDFVFIDTYMTYEQAKQDLTDWYDKVKDGGLFAGHDWNNVVVQQAVNEFRKEKNITGIISTFDDLWVWKK